jgi:hypothetical protein
VQKFIIETASFHGKVMIIVPTTDMVQEVAQLLSDKCTTCSVAQASSQDTSGIAAYKTSTQCRILVGTTIITNGLDEHNTYMVISYLASYSISNDVQQAGRIRKQRPDQKNGTYVMLHCNESFLELFGTSGSEKRKTKDLETLINMSDSQYLKTMAGTVFGPSSVSKFMKLFEDAKKNEEFPYRMLKQIYTSSQPQPLPISAQHKVCTITPADEQKQLLISQVTQLLSQMKVECPFCENWQCEGSILCKARVSSQTYNKCLNCAKQGHQRSDCPLKTNISTQATPCICFSCRLPAEYHFLIVGNDDRCRLNVIVTSRIKNVLLFCFHQAEKYGDMGDFFQDAADGKTSKNHIKDYLNLAIFKHFFNWREKRPTSVAEIRDSIKSSSSNSNATTAIATPFAKSMNLIRNSPLN